MLWSLAKNSGINTIIKEQIRTQKDIRKVKKDAYSDKIKAIQEQIRMKKIVWREHKRRVSQDPGAEPGKSKQPGAFKLYNRLKSSAEKEIKALEEELAATKKERDAEIAALTSQIDALEAQMRICR